MRFPGGTLDGEGAAPIFSWSFTDLAEAPSRRPAEGEGKMNFLRTAILLAGLTALFMGVGYLIGGPSGALIALLVAAE